MSKEKAFKDKGDYEWIINKDFAETKVGDKLSSDAFSIACDELKMQMKIYPNGSKEEFEGYAMIFVKIVSMPTNWRSITICKTIHSPQTKSSQTNMGKYNIGQNQGWKYVLPFNEIKDLNHLKICMSIKILRIYQKNEQIVYPKPFKYEKKQRLEFKLDDAMIKDLKHCKCGKMVESKIFFSMWCIRICPNGCTPRDSGKCALGLTLCGIPSKCGKLKVQWNISCDEMNIHSSQTSDFSTSGTTKGCNIGTFKQFGKLHDLSIVIDIVIIKEFPMAKITKASKQQSMTTSSVSSPSFTGDFAPGTGLENESNEESKSNNVDYAKKMALYDKRIKEMRVQFGNMNTKIQKLADLLTKTLQVNKRNDQNIKMLSNRLKQLSQNGGDGHQALQSKIDLLQREVSTLKQMPIDLSVTKNPDNLSSNDRLEILKKFLEKEAKLGDFYQAFVENGFESVESLYDVTMEDLKEIGINKLFHRKALLKCIRAKQNNGNVELSQSGTTNNAHIPEGSASFSHQSKW